MGGGPGQDTRTRARRAGIALALVCALGAALSGPAAPQSARGDSPPNIIFILTDDQTVDEMSALPATRSLIESAGATFSHAYVSFPFCCPSRATLLSGLYMHNHGVRGNSGPYGGWKRFAPRESNDLPVWLHNAGYYNVHIGKYLNGYAAESGLAPTVPDDWDQWYALIRANYYYNYDLYEKDAGGIPETRFYGNTDAEYQTNVFRDKAVGFIQNLTPSQTPFYLQLWFNAPHAQYTPSAQYRYTRAGQALSRPLGYNEANIKDKPRWLRNRVSKPFGPKVAKQIAYERRRRLEMLDSVDDTIEQLYHALEDKGVLDNTYIIFTSDNGFFQGEHRIASGKFLPYEPSSRVPLFISGPGIPAGVKSDELVSTLDIPQTILELATGSTDPSLDGRSLLPYAQDPTARTTRPILLEGDLGPGRGLGGGGGLKAEAAHVAGERGAKNLNMDAMKSAGKPISAPAFRAIRTPRYMLILYSNGQRELYDESNDPGQLRNVVWNSRYRGVRKWLFGHLISLASCDGSQCRADIGSDPAPALKSRARRHKRQRR
jgi:N-acetylglucosamine-6-sulfatase